MALCHYFSDHRQLRRLLYQELSLALNKLRIQPLVYLVCFTIIGLCLCHPCWWGSSRNDHSISIIGSQSLLLISGKNRVLFFMDIHLHRLQKPLLWEAGGAGKEVSPAGQRGSSSYFSLAMFKFFHPIYTLSSWNFVFSHLSPLTRIGNNASKFSVVLT